MIRGDQRFLILHNVFLLSSHMTMRYQIFIRSLIFQMENKRDKMKCDQYLSGHLRVTNIVMGHLIY